MDEFKTIGDLTPEIIRQSEMFRSAQEKWNNKFKVSGVKNEYQKEYFKKVYGDLPEMEPVTYEKLKAMFWKMANNLIPGYKISDPETYRTLLKSFLEDKGVLIMGGAGNGKTQFFKIMQQTLLNLRAPAYRIVNCIDVEQAIRTGGEYSDFSFGDLCFDDLGTESSETVIYGNRVNVMTEILQLRYNAFQNKGLKTHISTNLTPDEIEKRYGTRISERLIEMCRNIIFSWETFRK